MTTRFNLFRRVSQPELCCAVPQTEPLPLFLHSRTWTFGGVADEADFLSAGIREDIPNWAGNRNGFFLFHDLHYDGHEPAR